jgi:peptidyl-prolyl cis-trans isomerase C
MRFNCCCLLLSGFVFGQVAAPPQPVNVPDTTVVATVGDKKITAGEVRALTPPQAQQAMLLNPAATLQQIYVMKYLASEAEKLGLDKQSPQKEQIEFQRIQLLANVEITSYRNLITIREDEAQKYYQDHPDEYQQAKVRVIYIPFSIGQAKTQNKVRTEAEAKARIEDLRKQLLAGADFAKLAQENSEDKESAAKGGDYGVVPRNSNQPADVKNAIFALKAGGISAVVKLSNGFYVFKVDEFATQPFNDVSAQIQEKLRQERFDAWLKGIQGRFPVKLENHDFFPRQPAPAASR